MAHILWRQCSQALSLMWFDMAEKCTILWYTCTTEAVLKHPSLFSFFIKMHHLYEISFVLYTRHFRFKDDDVLTKNLGEMVNLILSIKQNQIMNLNFRARNFGILEYGSTAVISRLN